MTGSGPHVPFRDDLRAKAQDGAEFARPHELEDLALSALARLDEFVTALTMGKRIFVALLDGSLGATAWRWSAGSGWLHDETGARLQRAKLPFLDHR